MQYDASGNLTNDGYQSYTYDATGQQAYASGTALTQSYDGNGLRAKKVDNGAATYYLRSSVLGGQVLAEINSAGSWTRGYVYAGGQMIAVQAGGVNWVHQDPVTKSQRVTDGLGNVITTVDLDPWGGETAISSNQAFQPHRFTTYERDGNGGDEAMFRRYNRWHSRFDQPDPYDGSYNRTDPQSFNRYAYVQNDPVNFVDPSGLVSQEDFGTDPTKMHMGGGGLGGLLGGSGIYSFTSYWQTSSLIGGVLQVYPAHAYTTILFIIGWSGNGGGGGGGGGGRGGGTDPQKPKSTPTRPPQNPGNRNLCEVYRNSNRYDLYAVCMKAGTDPTSNCIRQNLQHSFVSNRFFGFYADPSALGFAGQWGLIFGPLAHAAAFSKCGLTSQ
jgi:RHS repeat-associated protein